MTLFCTSKNAQNDTQFNVDFWRENSNTFALKLYIVRIASNVVKGDFKSNFQILLFGTIFGGLAYCAKAE